MIAPAHNKTNPPSPWTFLDLRMLQEFRKVYGSHPDLIYARLEPLLQLAITPIERDKEIPDLLYQLDYLHMRWEETLGTADNDIWHDFYLIIAEQLPPLPFINEIQ